jgi:hypothetical protein
LRDVGAQNRSETALLSSLSNTGSISVLEQNFDFYLLIPQKLLEKYLGKNVTIIKTNPATGIESSDPATVLSANNGVVMRVGDRIETGIPGRIVYGDVPANLRDRPTLVTKLNNKVSAEQLVELSYPTGGLVWKADYVAEPNARENSIELSGWVTLTNASGTAVWKIDIPADDSTSLTYRVQVKYWCLEYRKKRQGIGSFHGDLQ